MKPAPPKIRTERNDSGFFISDLDRTSGVLWIQASVVAHPASPTCSEHGACAFESSCHQPVDCQVLHGLINVVFRRLRLEPCGQFPNSFFPTHVRSVTQELCG